MEVSECFVGSYFETGAGGLSPVKQKSIEQFTVDDLMDFSNEEVLMTDGFLENVTGNSTDSSTVTVVDRCNSSVSGSDNNFSGHLGSRNFADSQFSGKLFAPHDDLAELEWLSNFVEDSFTAEDKDLQALHFLSGGGGGATTKHHPSETSSSSATLQSLPSEASKNAPFIPSETPLPGKARSKRSRVAACDWSKRLLHLFTPTATDPKPRKTVTFKKRESSSNSDSSGRKCLHCASEKTPQWRTGPMGPKTLCNACGVRYKSGRLVPEYRPASSPTFISAKHSNSHRKVLELRRETEVKAQQNHPFQSQSSIFAVSNGSEEFLIHHQGSNFRHMI